MKNAFTEILEKAAFAAVFAAMLTGCASTKLTVDDGRELDPKLLSEITTYGAGATALRPAVVKSAQLKDEDCSNQYDLPFEVATSYGVKSEDARVAWVRALGINENLSILAADASSGVAVGDVVTEVDGYDSSNKLKMIQELIEVRDSGRPFKLKLASGREVSVTPLEVCRGHTVIAPPLMAATYNYHWTASMHPQQIFLQPLTLDEATWVILWTQGLSEEGGVRMKTYSFVLGSVKFAGLVAISAATAGAALAAGGGAVASGASMGAAVGNMFAVTLAGKTVQMMAQAAAHKASLSGINAIAGGVFDKADKWAFDNMKKLGMNPRAGLMLHEKMIEQGTAANAFLMDEERLAKMQALVGQLPKEPEIVEVFSVDATEPKLIAIDIGAADNSVSIAPADAAIAPADALPAIPVSGPEAGTAAGN